ncbi:cyclophilin-like fold protein [Methylobacterium sp. 37f]|uniref:cyclophilin-like fold protein n=1 Tax=Methylobacterium sp. 37f TaxID=2817058 RepID=UPI001FFDD966|nr:cyclophilin-like fold protein [Methylobacterium sp. 37f]
MRRNLSSSAILAVGLTLLSGLQALHAEPSQERRIPGTKPEKAPAMSMVRIRLNSSNGDSVTATLGDGESARAFRALLPLTLTLKDFNGSEKIGDLPKRLSVQGEPAGADPEPGDIAYYAPWGNLAIYYKDFKYSDGLVRLGRLSHIPDAFKRSGPVKVTIEAVP